MAKRTPPEISGGSMADIAFMLLIFFLVATTMDIDSGIMRVLPPPIPDDAEPPPPIKERNVFVVLVNKNNQLLVEGEPISIKQLKDKAKEFILNPQDKKDLPDKKDVDIPYFGKSRVSKGIISLQTDRGTSYETYIAVTNELITAGNEIRNDVAMKKFGKLYKDITKDKRNAIRKYVPVPISEAEPKNIGGD